MKPGLAIKNFRLKNFKAVQDSKAFKFNPLTVLIGNNGSGKSSLIEGLETFRHIVTSDLDLAMMRWFSMQHVWNKRANHDVDKKAESQYLENPIQFTLNGYFSDGPYRAEMKVNTTPGQNAILIQEENYIVPHSVNGAAIDVTRDAKGCVMHTRDNGEVSGTRARKYHPAESAIPYGLRDFVKKWQFLNLSPDPMGRPTVKSMAVDGDFLLNRDGSNLAQYLLSIRSKNTAAFEGIVEAMQYVLDYAQNFEPVESRDIQPTVHLNMLEKMRDESVEIPGWLISTGTLRVLALLAVLRNPDPPPLLVVEEIENGLDPRTLNLVLEEIRMAVESRTTQIILTTHSPYFLDLLDLSHLVLCERINGVPVFKRPADIKSVAAWAKDFSPGRLYTMDRLHLEKKR